MEKAIIVGADLGDFKINQEMKELKELCLSCNIKALDQVVQKLDRINPKTYLGKGKLEDIKIAINSLDIEVVVFNDELTSSQIRNLEEILETKIYDRTYLILEIFKTRAKTKEAFLQVEIASLQYMLPRLIGLRKNLSKQRSGAGGASYSKGGGETYLEQDRRTISNKVTFLKRELAALASLRFQQRNKRKKTEIPTVSLVGYTNSGKSSTLNAILQYSQSIKKEVVSKNLLFATLETSTRLISMPNNKDFLLTDTIGFISKLPHTLVESFKSTLQEILESSLIVHVVDSTSDFHEQIEITNSVIKELGVEDIKMIYAFNKADVADSNFFIPKKYEPAISISAKKDINIDELIALITANLFDDHIDITIKLPYDKMFLVDFLKNNASISKLDYQNEFIIIDCNLSKKHFHKVEEYKI